MNFRHVAYVGAVSVAMAGWIWLLAAGVGWIVGY